MPQTVGGTGSAVTIEAKILFLEDGLEKFALPVWKNEGSGFGHAPWFASMETSPTSGASNRQKIEFPPPKKPFEAEGKILLTLETPE